MASDAAGLPELAGHVVQVSDVCAVDPLYWPVPQSVHAAADAGAALNVPAPHGVTLLAEPVKPASAVQVDSAVEPVEPPVPELVGQLVHEAAPVTVLNVPAAQAATELPTPVWPASARQSVAAVLPVVLPVPELEGHAEHAAAEPAAALKVPAAQTVTELPTPVWPASARQSVAAELAVLPPVPELVGQLVHAAEPVAVL